MMIKATDIRRGMVITMEGVNFVVVDFAHHTPGNLRAMVQTKLRNMNNNAQIEKRFRSVDQIEVPYVETKEHLGGFAVVDVPDDAAARYWAGRIAVAVGWPQEVHRFPHLGWNADRQPEALS